MLDFLNETPNSTAVSQQWFYGNGVWQPYILPRGCSQVFILGIGGGGGGGGGLTGATSTNRGGGSGGGSGAMTRALFPRWALPDVLYIQTGSSVNTFGAASGSGTGGGIT